MSISPTHKEVREGVCECVMHVYIRVLIKVSPYESVLYYYKCVHCS